MVYSFTPISKAILLYKGQNQSCPHCKDACITGVGFSLKEMVPLYLRFVSVAGLLLICRFVARHKASTLLRLHALI